MPEIKLAFLGTTELLVVLLIAVLLFGASRLPKLGDALGKGIRNFKNAFRGNPQEVESEARRLEEGGPAGQLPPHEAELERQRAKEKQNNSAPRET